MYPSTSPAPGLSPDLIFRRIRRWGVIFMFLVGVFVAACIFIPSWYINRNIEPTMAPPGNAAQFDPIQALPAIRSYVGTDAQLVSLYAQMVRSDGTQDLQATYTPGPKVVYSFTKGGTPSEKTPPVGTGVQEGYGWRQAVTVSVSRPGQRYFVKKQSGGFSSSYSYVSKGMQKTEDAAQLMRLASTVTPPGCTLQGLWKQAIAAGAPSDGVADILYDGKMYTFKIYGRPLAFAFGLDCAMMR